VGSARPRRHADRSGGSLVTPGLIDLHTHVYHGLATGRHADQACLANGVTTVVDAGSAGWMTLRGLRDYVIPTYQTRVYMFLHISATGLVINRIMPELAEIKFAQVEETARTVVENRADALAARRRSLARDRRQHLAGQHLDG
jgi:dihydroorotase